MLLQELTRRGVLDNTLVIVTSDHGEHLGDHLLFFHGCSLYRQLVNVPLVIVDPGRAPAGRAIAAPVSLRDIPATVVDLLGLDRGAPFPGRSLARFWSEKDPPRPNFREPLLMETGKPRGLTNQGREPVVNGPMKGLIAETMHYIRRGDGLEELYLLDTDLEERSNVAAYSFAPDILRQFRTRLSAMLRKP
jgi:arylsulfatase A-like enzyme